MLNYQRVSKDKTPSWKCVQLVFTASTVSQLGASGKRSVYQKPSSCSTLQHQPLGKAVEREMVGQMALFCFWKINRPKVDSFSSCFRPSLLSRSAAEHPTWSGDVVVQDHLWSAVDFSHCHLFMRSILVLKVYVPRPSAWVPTYLSPMERITLECHSQVSRP